MTRCCPTVADAGAAYVVMHTRGTPRTMLADTHYDDVVVEVAGRLRAGAERAAAAGIDRRAILVDPGIGFAKNAEQNVALLRALPELATGTGMPMMVGASRKSFLGRILDDIDADREGATMAITIWCFLHGVAVVRVHDVERSRRAAQLLDVMERATEIGVAA